MGRKKAIEEDKLIALINDYYIKVCGGRARRMKLSAIAQYIRENGYPKFQDYTLRRSETARKHIEKLKAKETKPLITVADYKTLDVANLLKNNPSKAQL